MTEQTFARPRRVAGYRVADYLVDAITTLGVDTVFGVGGANIEDLYDAAHFNPTITAILAKHEFSATTMADGYSRSGTVFGQQRLGRGQFE